MSFNKLLQYELNINSESWKRKLAIKAYRYKFFFYYIKPNKFKLFVSKIFSFFVSFFIRSNIPNEKVYIGQGLRIPHGFENVILSEYLIVGENVTIFHNVTIGILEGIEYKYGDIKIGNNVIIGVGTTILGKCVIGDNCRIGANSLIISENIAPNSLVVAPKAIIKPGYYESK